MASILALELAGDQLHVLRLEGSSGRVDVRKSFTATLPKPLLPAHAEEIGSWLKNQLAERQLGGGDVVACLGRGQATFKQIEVPDVPAAELPSMVQLAVEAESDDSVTHVIDFDLGTMRKGQRQVTAALASDRTVNALRETLKAAGLNPLRLSVRPYAMRFMRDRLLGSSGDDDTTLMLAPSPEGFDISIWDGGRLELARTIYPNGALPEQNASKLAAELKRTLASFQVRKPNAEIASIAAVTGDASEFAPTIEAAFHKSLAVVDPSSKITSTNAGNATALGAIGAGWLVLAGEPQSIDLFNPKKPPAPKYSVKRLGILGGALAACIFGAALYWRHQTINALETDIRGIAGDIAVLDKEITTNKPLQQRHAEISKWIGQRIDWLDKLTELSHRFPDTDKAYLSSLRGTTVANASLPMGEMVLEMNARRPDVVTPTHTKLGADSQFEVIPKGSQPNNDVSDFKYSEKFDIRFLAKAAPLKKGVEPEPRTMAKLSPGKRRVPTGLGKKSKTAASSTPRPMVASRIGGDFRGRNRGGSNNDSQPSTSSSTSSSSSESTGSDALAAKIERLKALPLDEFERELLKEPALFRNRIRNKVQEARGAK